MRPQSVVKRITGNTMRDTTWKWTLLAVRALLTLAFVAAVLAKLSGAQIMLDEFGMLKIGQWFCYGIGMIEVVSAILLWVPGLTAIGAGSEVCVMIGALIAHMFVLGMGAFQGVWVLGPLALITLYFNRDHLNRFIG